MSILPSFMMTVASEVQKETVLEIPKEYGINFKTGQLTGKIVEGKEAIKVWIWNCLKTQRFRYPIYSWDYGADLEQYIEHTVSEEYLNTDGESEIKEALMVNPYIEGISDFSAEVQKEHLTLSFKVETKFGEMEVEQSV